MGVIKITPRSSSLQSGHSAGAGSVHVPHLPTNIDTGEIRKWKGVDNLGRGIADFGEKMLRTVGVFAEIRNETQLDEFESDFLGRIHEANMNPETGFMTRRLGTTADVETLAKDGPRAYKDIFDEVAEAHGMTGVKKNWAMNRVGRTIESANYRLANRVSAAYQQLNLSQAAANLEARHAVWNDGMDDPAATEELLDAGRKLLYAQGLDDKAVELKLGEQVESLAEEYASRRFSDLPSEAAVDAELRKLKDDPSGVLAGNRVLAGQFSTRHPFSQNVTDRLKGRLERRRHEIQVRDQQIVDQAANVGFAAAAQIRDKDGNYTPGRLATVEQSIESLRRIGASLPSGSRAAAEAVAEASRLGNEADKEVFAIIENRLLAGEDQKMDDGKTLIYDQNTESRFIKLYPAAKAKVDEIMRKDRSRAMADNARELRLSEVLLDYAIQDGTLSEDQIAYRKRDIYDRARAMTEGRLLSPDDAASFRKRWAARNAADESAAAVEFDRAFGLSLRDFVDAKGEISAEATDAGYKKAVRSGQEAVFPGTDEDVSLGDYLKMRASYLERLRALPENADRRQETSKLLAEFKGGWYARQTEANIEALARTMNDIHVDIEAEIKAERLRSAAEEKNRSRPTVGSPNQEDAEPSPEVLDYYRQANPFDPTLKF